MDSEQQETSAERPPAVRFTILLGAFFLLLLSIAFVRSLGMESGGERLILRGVVTLTFLAVVGSAAYSLPATPLMRRLIRTLGMVTAVLFIAVLFSPSDALELAAFAACILYLGSTVVLISRLVLRATEADYETIAASLCAYLMLGLIWAFLYALADLLAPGSFAYQGDPWALSFGAHDSAKTLYFSYVILTTVGFGDVTPTSDPARMLTVLEAITGQLFLVVMVARLVGMSIVAPRRK
jgi:hypothetical protein